MPLFETLSRRALALGFAATAALGVALVPAQAEEGGDYVLATASTGGTYYPVGVAISTLTKVKLQPEHKIGMSAISSAGSGENVRLLRTGEAQFAILQGLFGHYAWNGTGPVEADGPQRDLRAVTMLWQNVEHFVVAAQHAETGTIADFVALDGAKVALGRRNSGTIGSNRTILANLGADFDGAYDLFYAGYGPSADALQNGQVAGMSTPAGAPASAVTRLLAARGEGVRLLSFTPEQAEKADGGLKLWTPYTIEAGTYPGQDEPVETIAQPNFLAVRADLPEDHVYRITKAMYENLAFLQAIHPATKAMALDRALAGLPLPLHPGAARFFEEAGIAIPEGLRAP